MFAVAMFDDEQHEYMANIDNNPPF